jgi:hypothetical protein
VGVEMATMVTDLREWQVMEKEKKARRLEVRTLTFVNVLEQCVLL